jgi:hypothetical protein
MGLSYIILNRKENRHVGLGVFLYLNIFDNKLIKMTLDFLIMKKELEH